MEGSIFDLHGKVAIVTGASRGLGQAIAVTLAEAGAQIAVTARSLSALDETRKKVEQFGKPCIAIAQDVRDIPSISDAVKQIRERAGKIDILVNNAGFESVCNSLEVNEALWDSIVDTNLKGAFFWSQAAARAMVEQKSGGSIVNLCSLTSYVGIPTAVPYTSSKSGLLGMTRALAAEWAEIGVRVNAVAPGYFRTAMTEEFYQNSEWQDQMLAKIPQRRFGHEQDIGGTVVYLCSDASTYVTGHCIPVDGGFLASI